jgi:hypothetical protein
MLYKPLLSLALNVTFKFFVNEQFKIPLYTKSKDPLPLNVGPIGMKFDGPTIATVYGVVLFCAGSS